MTEGMDVVEAIEKVATTSKGGHGDVPQDEILVEKVVVD